MASKRESGSTSRPSRCGSRLVHELERRIAGPVEAAVRSDEYFDLVAQLNRARARVTKTRRERQRGVLHMFNLPAATDLRRVREQLTRVSSVSSTTVAKTLDDSDEASEEPRRQLAQLEQQLAEIATTLGGRGRTQAATKDAATESPGVTPRCGPR